MAPLLTVAIAAILALRAIHPDSTSPVPESVPTPDVPLYKTALRWAGDPIYCITNDTHFALHAISFQNWANHNLAIYAVGRSTTAHLPETLDRFPPLPVSLPPGRSAWFVGSDAHVHEPYTLYCSVNGREQYITLHLSQ